MTWYILLIIVLTLLMSLFAAGTPVFLSFLALNVAGLLYLSGVPALNLIVNSMYSTGTSFSLAAIPMFILLGEILFRTGSVGVLFNAVDRIIGNFRARLFGVVISLSTIFGALSGSSMAVAAMMGGSMLPEMRKRGYHRGLSLGSIVAGAALAPIIPPSILAILVGMLAGVSISQILIAGVIPGLILALAFLIYLVIRARLNPDAAPLSEDTLHSGGSAVRDLLLALPFLGIIVLVLGLILGGVATPTESAGAGVIAAIVITLLMRRLNWERLRIALASTTRISGMILIIMVCSVAFSQLLSFSGASHQLVAWVTALDLNPWVMFIALMALAFVLCMFIDQIALMLLLIPLYLPLTAVLGFDPLWFWTMFLINISIGNITPPFGYTLFALKGTAPDIPMGEIYRSVWPFVGIFIAGMVLFALVPQFILYLPSLI